MSAVAEHEADDDDFERVADSLFGYHMSPINRLFDDPAVTEIMVVGDRVYVERAGRIVLLEGVSYASDARLRDALTNFGTSVGREMNEDYPILDARLENGARLCGVLPPVAVDGPTMTLRPLRDEAFSLTELCERRMLSDLMASWLMRAVMNAENLVVSGGTGSGKTTLLRALTSIIPSEERVLVVEDTCERLVPGHDHVIEYETVRRPPEARGEEVAMGRLIETAMRSRPDRIIVGEIRNGEAAEAFIEALNTGHGGTLTTTHANGGWETLQRIAMLHARATPHVPYEVLQRLVSLAVDVVVNVGRVRIGGERRRAVKEIGVVTNDGEVLPVFTIGDDGGWKYHRTNDPVDYD